MKSYAKINIFLKIVGARGNYHEILSRFVLRREIYDEIYFEKSDGFAIECSNANIENNIILKAKKALENVGFKNEIDEFFGSHKVILNKNIPIGAGLGGGSSNAAAFLNLTNGELNLK
ncbi:MAG: 4-(cytidine 5'-diphospho)-2-C-methyl-D-erythritol kinase, partial [Campylobacter sp.]|nr:4-(cytidine 5'-diphospho)-2-C-methyl-D-erythritol kinase [Campylobacter sp.]